MRVGRVIVGAAVGAGIMLGTVGAVVLVGYWRATSCYPCSVGFGSIRVGPETPVVVWNGEPLTEGVQIQMDPVPFGILTVVAAVLGGVLPLVWRQR